jgi:hypothetical protein
VLITQSLQKVWPIDQNGHSPFVKVRVVGDYDKLYTLCVELKELTTHHTTVVNNNRINLGNRSMVRKRKCLRCWCCAPRVDEEKML